METLHASILGVVVAAVGSSAQSGPGSGPWEVVTPESQGLESRALEVAEEEVNRLVGERSCYVVTKNGKIVMERYRRGRTVSSVTELYSHTKSLCSSVFGVAVQQGWASEFSRVGVTDPEYGTRECNPSATFQNVLTMTGMSKDIREPEFYYDASGQDCLDTIQDTISENNPDGLYAVAWKDKYWAKPLGIEHTRWGILGYLNCGFSARASCRDAARVGQLWNNNGAWPGYGQLMPEEYARRARTWVFPGSRSWAPYGYTLWLWLLDDVDPEVAMMGGANAQCTLISPEHDAVIVSFGMDEQDDCEDVWQASKYAIVASDHPKWRPMNSTELGEWRARQADSISHRKAERAEVHGQELLEIRAYIANSTQYFSDHELGLINKRLVKMGAEKIWRK